MAAPRPLRLGAFGAIVGLVACAGKGPTPPATAPAAGALPPATAAHATPEGVPGPMKPLRAKSELVPALVAAGLDAARFPPLGQLSKAERGAVMTSFTKALGVPCDGCHLPDDFFAATPRKLIAGQMWEQIVRPLAVASGEPLYCDSCHQGSLLFVDRGAHLKPAADYMKANFVEKLSHGADGDAGDVTCETCHGKPFEPEFLGAWSRAKSP